MNDKTIQELREKVFTAIGEASMCWIPTPQGIFDSTRAEKVGRRLVDEILSRAEQEAKEEPLAVLSYKRGFGVAYGWGEIDMSGNPHQFEIWFTDKGSRHRLHLVVGKTYAECEAKARAYLTGLPDKEKGNEK